MSSLIWYSILKEFLKNVNFENLADDKKACSEFPCMQIVKEGMTKKYRNEGVTQRFPAVTFHLLL